MEEGGGGGGGGAVERWGVDRVGRSAYHDSL